MELIKRQEITAKLYRWLLAGLVVTIFAKPEAAFTQDIGYVRASIDSLASPRFQGRGYVKKGDKIAAAHIQSELQASGVSFFGDSPQQSFYLGINTFPGKMEIKADGIPLVPGRDFYVSLSSPAVSGTFQTLWLDSKSLKTEEGIRKFTKKDLSDIVLILDTGYDAKRDKHAYTARAIIQTHAGKMSWHVADGAEVMPFAYIHVLREKIPSGCEKISLDVEAEFHKAYVTQNIAGYIQGTQYPDSFIVFTAHYDHLGRMGAETYFPGAHDNASGCAMVLDLARHYAKPENRPAYSIAFIFFSGEEAGLLGSGHYVNHPLFPLNNIKFLINLDMESTGSQGIKVVNGSVYKNYFDLLVKINGQKQLLSNVSPRGEAANSDHYPFYKKGVKCFYIYTLGDEWKEYHTPTDVSQGLPMTKYNELFRLVTEFVKELDSEF